MSFQWRRRQFCALLSLFGVFTFNMSSTGSGKRVVWEKGEKKDVVSSSPPATRTRAQTRADRATMNPNVISPRSATVKATIASSGPRGISPRGSPSTKKVPRRPGINYGQVVIPLNWAVLSPHQLPEPLLFTLHARMIFRLVPR